MISAGPEWLSEACFFAGDVYFDIKSIGERYGKFGGAADSQPEPGELSNVKILKCVPRFRDGFWFAVVRSLVSNIVTQTTQQQKIAFSQNVPTPSRFWL